MDFNNLIRLANKNEVHAEKKRSTLKPGLPPPSTSKKDAKPAKGINSAAVRAVLAEQERLEKEKTQKSKQKPSAPMKDATSAPKAPSSKPCPADDDLDCDLKKLFNKNSKRVPHVPDSSIPNMLEVLKEKEKLRKQKEKEEDEERIQRERELLRERGERERERQREEKEKTHRHSSDGSSKHKQKNHHSDQKFFTSSTSSDNKSNGKSRPGQFKIPKKPPISYDDILALAAKKQGEPDAATPAAPVVNNKPVATSSKPEPPKRPMTQEEKDRWARQNSEVYQNWLKNGGPPPKNLPQSSKGKNSSSLNKEKASSDSQLDRRNSIREEPVASRSDKCKMSDKSQSPDRGRTMDRPSAANGQAKTNDRSQSNGHIKPNGVRSSTSQLPSNQPNRTEATSSRLSESQRKSKPAEQPSGLKRDQISSELNRSIKPSVSHSQKDMPVKNVIREKDVDVYRSNPNINKRPQDSQRLKSSDTKANNSAPSSTGGGGGGGGSSKEQVMKDFYIQCKKLKESGFLSDSILKSLENELREKLKSLRKGDSSNASKPNTSGNSSRPSSDNKLSAKPSASQLHQGTSKVMPSNNKVKSSIGVSSSNLKRDEKSDLKSVSVWDKICAENRQFKPKLNPVAVKRRLLEHDSEDEDDDEDDEYDEDDDDMDSFIDDGEDVGGTDYSAYIRSMTKYDPSKYDDDFDDPSMETSYAQVLKEEAYSAREGRREDIEDMVMEEEENRRKLMKKKATSKRPRLS